MAKTGDVQSWSGSALRGVTQPPRVPAVGWSPAALPPEWPPDFPFAVVSRVHRPADVQQEHRHERVELVHVLAGSTNCVVGDQLYRLEPGDFVVVPGGEVHSLQTRPGVTPHLQLVAFAPEVLSAPGAPADPDPFRTVGLGSPPPSRHLAPTAVELEHFQRLLTRLQAEAAQRRPGFASMVRALLHQLFIELGRALLARGYVPGSHIPRSAAERSVVAALAVLSAAGDDLPGLAAVARRVGVSPAYLSRIFREVTGIHFRAYVAHSRHARARELLARGDLSIISIALQLGYDSPTAFSRAFRRLAGMSPAEFRKKSAV